MDEDLSIGQRKGTKIVMGEILLASLMRSPASGWTTRVVMISDRSVLGFAVSSSAMAQHLPVPSEWWLEGRLKLRLGKHAGSHRLPPVGTIREVLALTAAGPGRRCRPR